MTQLRLRYTFAMIRPAGIKQGGLGPVPSKISPLCLLLWVILSASISLEPFTTTHECIVWQHVLKGKRKYILLFKSQHAGRSGDHKETSSQQSGAWEAAAWK